jgi:hypothetical protein
LCQLFEVHAIHPQKIEIHKDNLKTLNDFQKLLGDIVKVRAHKGGVRIDKTPKKLASICCP